MRYLAVSIGALVLSGLVAPTIALGQQPTPKPTLTATPGVLFPDRSYILRLPSRAAVTRLSVTENGGPVCCLAISVPGDGASFRISREYVITYRSILGPQRKAIVEARVAGHAPARATYTTPALGFRVAPEQQWEDRVLSPTTFVIVAVLALMALALFPKLKR